MLKRATDLVGAAAGLVLLSPLIGAIALAVRLLLGSPVLFRQDRLGVDERSFTVFKFRTMTDARDATGALLPDAERLTLLGRALRAASLDELPELWNVLRGDMSLVGPRPLPSSYRPRFTPEERTRHAVRPGITGWAQVSGRNRVDWDERLAMDVWYAGHHTLRLDLRILALTVPAVLRRRGVAAEGQATMHVLRPELRRPGDDL